MWQRALKVVIVAVAGLEGEEKCERGEVVDCAVLPFDVHFGKRKLFVCLFVLSIKTLVNITSIDFDAFRSSVSFATTRIEVDTKKAKSLSTVAATVAIHTF